jgi:hypothetical protein
VSDDEDGGGELVRLLMEELEDLDSGAEVELAGGLVREQHRVARRQRACDRHPLLLAAGKLVLEAVQGPTEADARQHRGRVSAAAADLGAELNVLERGQAGEEVERLEDEAHGAPPEASELLPRRPGQVDAAHDDAAFGGDVERADHVQQRGLAATGGTEHNEELARAHLEVDSREPVNRAVARPVHAGDAVEPDQGGATLLRASCPRTSSRQVTLIAGRLRCCRITVDVFRVAATLRDFRISFEPAARGRPARELAP